MTATQYLGAGDWLNSGAGPLYVRLRQRLQQGIASGILNPENALPAEREIAALTGVSRVTVRRAMQELVDTGVIVQRQGSGSFVAERQPRFEQSLSRLTSFSEDMQRRGLNSRSQWLERGIFVPSPGEVMTLGLSSGDYVARIARLRLADDRPMAIERAALPLDILPNPLVVEASLYDVLDKTGHRPMRALQRISATNLDNETAALLGTHAGAAGLSIERTSYLASGRVAEFTRSIYRGDAYDFVAELRLAPRKESQKDPAKETA